MKKKLTQELSPKNSFIGFNWGTFLRGFKKPALVLIAAGITFIAGIPALAGISAMALTALGGSAVIGERIWALAEFFIKEIELK